MAQHRILVIDDDPIIRTLVTEMLRRSGFGDISAVGSADEALAGSGAFDLMLADWSMAGTDGVSFIQMVRAGNTVFDAQTPIILLSGAAGTATSDAAAAAGATAILGKPVIRAALVEAVNKALSAALSGD